MKQLSYCLIGDPMAVHGIKSSDDVVLSGLWQWHLAFEKYGSGGSVELIRRKEELEEYDIIHINMTAGNLSLPQMVREELKDSDTKLVVNIDFDVMQWGANWQYPTLLTKAIDHADMIFHVEPTGSHMLSHLLNRRVETIPHPVDIVGIDRYKKSIRDKTIVTMFHRYIPDIFTPYIAQKNVPLYRIMLGYTGNVPALPMYDFVAPHTKFVESLEIMSKAKFGCDLYPGRSFGRSVIEFAALMIPCVCSNTIAASNTCFPDLAVDPFDTKGAEEKINHLIEDDDEYIRIMHDGYERCGCYSQRNSYKQFVEAHEYSSM